MKFVLDEMLGSSSRWLRMLGFDVKYFKASDNDLLKVAMNEDRILLTKDLELFNRAKNSNLKSFLLRGDDEPERLANVSRHFNIKLEIIISKSRCPVCNSLLKFVEKKAISDKVFKGTLCHFDDFWICTSCGKIYWQGKHWKQINETLARARNLQNMDEPIINL